jgi:hypothetical protein
VYPTDCFKLLYVNHHYIRQTMIFATKSVKEIESNIKQIPMIHRNGRGNCAVHFSNYKHTQRNFTCRVLTECKNLCDDCQNSSNRKKPAIHKLPENKNLSNSKLRE